MPHTPRLLVGLALAISVGCGHQRVQPEVPSRTGPPPEVASGEEHQAAQDKSKAGAGEAQKKPAPPQFFRLRENIYMIDDDTVVVPGHGVYSSKRELVAYLAMIKDVQAKVDLAIRNGATLEEVKADTTLTAAYDAKYGNLYINGERFRDLIYNGSNSAWTR